MLSGHASAMSQACGSSVACVRNCSFRVAWRFARVNDELYESSRGNRVDGLPRVASDREHLRRSYIGEVRRNDS